MTTILERHNVERVVVPYLPVGWTRDALMAELAPMIDNHRAHVLLGDLDRATWPYAKAGFFGVKKQIDKVLRQLGINGAEQAQAS